MEHLLEEVSSKGLELSVVLIVALMVIVYLAIKLKRKKDNTVYMIYRSNISFPFLFKKGSKEYNSALLSLKANISKDIISEGELYVENGANSKYYLYLRV